MKEIIIIVLKSLRVLNVRTWFSGLHKQTKFLLKKKNFLKKMKKFVNDLNKS
jgi:hypothetical protein